MPKQIQLSIPTPCHENWDAMTPEKQGRFCSSCSKTVLDFTLMTDSQIVDAIKKAGENACGRFTNDQLERPLVEPLQPKWYLNGMWKYALSSFLLFKGIDAKTQIKPGVVLCAKPKNDSLPNQVLRPTMGIIAKRPTQKEVFYKGIVQSEFGEPIVSATIIIIGSNQKVVTDKDGKFSLYGNAFQEIEIVSTGYEVKKVKLSSKENNIILNQYQKMGEVVVVAGRFRSSDDEDDVQTTFNTKIYYSIKDIITTAAIPNASIVIERNGKMATSFADGNGTFQVKRIKDNDKINITVSSVGYKTKSISIKGSDLEKGKLKNEILLEKDVKKGEEAIVIGYGTVKGAYVTMGSTQMITKDDLIKVDTAVAVNKKEIENVTRKNASFNFYPNPIAAGQSLQLQYKASKEEMIMFQLITLEGKTILLQKEKAVIGENKYNIQIPANVAAQTIVVQLINSVGKKVGTEKIVVL